MTTVFLAVSIRKAVVLVCLGERGEGGWWRDWMGLDCHGGRVYWRGSGWRLIYLAVLSAAVAAAAVSSLVLVLRIHFLLRRFSA